MTDCPHRAMLAVMTISHATDLWLGALPGWPTGSARSTRRVGGLSAGGRAYYGCSEDAVAVVVKRDRREPMCAAHVRGAIRSAANTARQLAEHQERRARDQQTKERLADLGRRLGGVSLAQEFLWSSGVHSTTTCVVGIDDLERLADRIGRGEATH